MSDQVTWEQTSPADYDRRLAFKGHKRAPADQGGLFYVPTPTRQRQAARVPQMPGQGDLFGTGPADEDPAGSECLEYQ